MNKFLSEVKLAGFNIRNYDILNNVDDFEIINQLRIREKISSDISIINSTKLYDYFKFFKNPTEMVEFFNSISTMSKKDAENKINESGFGEHFIKNREELSNELFLTLSTCFKGVLLNNNISIGDTIDSGGIQSGWAEMELSHSDYFNPLNRIDLEGIARQKAVRGVRKGDSILPSEEEVEALEELEGSKDFFYDFLNESISKIMDSSSFLSNFSHPMYVSFDISRADSDLINDFKKLLPIWRNELNIISSEKKRDWGYVRGKIIDYRIIALIDLINFSDLYKLACSKKILALLLYPDGERDGFALSQTVFPFLEKIKGKSYKLQSEHRIYKDKNHR